MSARHFQNSYADFEEEVAKKYLDVSLQGISDAFKTKIKTYEARKMKELAKNQSEIFSDDCAFTGSAGIAYLHYLYAKIHRNDARRFLVEAANYLQFSTSRRPRITFLCGAAGPLALGIVVGHVLGGDRPDSLPEPSVLAKRLENLWSVGKHPNTPDELLYGRTGYLYSLLFVNKETGQQYISPALIREVIEKMFESGQKLGSQHKTTLMYEWHSSVYLGAAHGFAGILFMMLQAKEYLSGQQFEQLVVPTLDWLLMQRYPDGNLRSSHGSDTNKLVQWCHGAPGLVQLCCLAYKILGDQKYLDAALACGEVVWNRGLCSKGYSICHGVAGNAYTFLDLYQTTKDPKHLYRACCFADWCIDERPSTENHYPDAPMSLFEGLAGRLYLLADIKNPMNAKFPAYTL